MAKVIDFNSARDRLRKYRCPLCHGEVPLAQTKIFTREELERLGLRLSGDVSARVCCNCVDELHDYSRQSPTR